MKKVGSDARSLILETQLEMAMELSDGPLKPQGQKRTHLNVCQCLQRGPTLTRYVCIGLVAVKDYSFLS